MESSPSQAEDLGANEKKSPSMDGVITPDSADRPKSTASGDIVFESKRKKRRYTPSLIGDESHDVTITVTIAMAVPTEHDDQPDLKEILKKRLIEAPRAQNYYHLEYRLLPPEPTGSTTPGGPGADDELTKTDVVTYGVACKVYMDKHDARVVKTWQDGDITWFSWAHSHTISVSKELLLRMFNHTVELRVWDTKDKCSTRARFDRPKAFRLPQPKPGEKPEDIGGVKAMVTKQMKNYIAQQPRKGVPIRQLPSEISIPHFMDHRKHSMSALESRRSRSGQISSSAASKTLVAVPNKDARDGKTFDRLGQLAGAQRLEERSSPRSKKSKGTTSSPSKSQSGKSRSGGHLNEPGDDKSLRKTPSKEEREQRKLLAEKAKANAEYIKKNGICMIPLRLALLFGDKKNITSRLEEPLPGVEDLFFSVTANVPLLSESQKEDLNPMMIQIKSATALPAAPLSFADLRLKCHPVFCKYKFFKEPEHVTPGKEHDRNIYWEDTSVALLGTMEPSELREFLNGPGMQVEVHDRDRKPEEVTLKPMLFGDDLEDEKIANVGTVESRRTTHNPFKGRDKPWDPYGLVQVDLSELLLGHRYLELKLPIQNCPLPDVLGQVPADNSNRLLGVAGAVDGPVERPLSAGQYVQDTAMLKLKIELAHPLTTPSKLAAKEYIQTSKECPFNRIIFLFGYSKTELLNNLQTLVMGINARALGLDTMPQHVIDAALSTYKLSVVQQCSLDLDIVTGFHVLDGQQHMFVLEGLRDKAISLLWDALPRPDSSDVQVLYNSDLSFSRRLYGPLDVDLCRVKLHEPLSVIVQQSLLYIRDMVFRPCFDALMKLDQIMRSDKMKAVVRNELFPTAEMVVSMSREFGVPFTQKDFEELQCKPLTQDETRDQEGSTAVTMVRPLKPEPSRNWTPIDNFNKDYVDSLKKGQKRQDFVEANILEVQAQSEVCRAERERTRKPRIYADVGETSHNYSTQALNSMELAREKLRNYLNSLDPDGRYAFNQEYLSAMFCPVNLKLEEKEAAAAERAKWKSPDGWIFPGVKSTKESNQHPKQLDPARLDELNEEWIENILHSNIFRSPLERGPFPWPARHDDIDLYTKPPLDFNNKEPLSIHSTGVQKEAERLAVKMQQFEDWKSRIIVDDTCQHFHRVLPATEMLMKGFYSSNQIDRLRGMLKDPPKKLGLMLEEPSPNYIPALAVVNNPFVDTDARALGASLQPAVPEEKVGPFRGYKPGMFNHSWSHNDNHVPCYDYEHDVFRSKNGKDFNVYHKSRNKLNLRPIVRLREEEKENHLFRVPIFSASPYPRPLPQVGQRSQTAQARLMPDHQNRTVEPPTNISEEAVEKQVALINDRNNSGQVIENASGNCTGDLEVSNAVSKNQPQPIPVMA
ncbi:hypothetical protein PoB_007150300 [Plakobranchus ocellatus]|uniref:DUF4550 domain-containing protein n=1 Tax=Plakobranchus ocellatus TaxID=259542 RepID=A0AAV4DL71_9GAST|nr:hypothetical protein PoB_007150300 [Plakobranchus ocellatus]